MNTNFVSNIRDATPLISIQIYQLKLIELSFTKGCPHGRTQGCFASYFCTCTKFSASYTYKCTCACTSATSSDIVGFFVRRTRVRRTNERACFIQMGLLSSLAFQIIWCFYKIYIFLLFWLWKLPEFYFLAQAFANLHGKRRQGKFIWKSRIYMLQTCKHDTAKLIFQKVLIF